jgi:predicted dehydrogenase
MAVMFRFAVRTWHIRLVLALAMMPLALAAQPVRVGVAGLTHGHVDGILRYAGNEIEVVGIAESDPVVVEKYRVKYGFSMDIVYDSVAELIDATHPDALAAYNAISQHRAVVEQGAIHGIDVMVEKPLAFSMEDARAMKAAAEAAGIHLLTNYQTTWWNAVHEAGRIVDSGQIGDIRKVVVHDGHEGPQEIDVSPEFFEWLTDPEMNGGGALVDFGCYGADIATWLMKGERPVAVTATTQRIKPEIYPNVDDEATIVVEYPKAQLIIQASWNWPFSRKDMAVYGAKGYMTQDTPTQVSVRLPGEDHETSRELEWRAAPYRNEFTYLAAVVRGDVDPAGSLSGLDTNVTVVEILDAARESARTGARIKLR